MLNGPFSPWPSFTNEEADAVRDVILSGKVNYWTGTDRAASLKKNSRRFAGTNHAIALANGTACAGSCSAWSPASAAANGGSETDEVIVTPRSFIASASSVVVNAGAKPIFADVDRDSQNITPATVEPL